MIRNAEAGVLGCAAYWPTVMISGPILVDDEATLALETGQILVVAAVVEPDGLPATIPFC